MRLEHERVQCPNCPPYKSPTLSVNRSLGLYHCFRCGLSGKSKRIIRPLDTRKAPKEIEWPDNYSPLRPGTVRSLCQRAAIRYLRNRGLTDEEIVSYRIGYCSNGFYKGRVIVPITNGNEIVYFVARAISEAEPRRYLNPPMPKMGVTFKTFIGKANRAVVVEGVFDAISVARVLPSIALLSKNPTIEQIRLVGNLAEQLVVMLDADAVADALSLSEQLSFYTNVRTVRLKKGDPANLTVEELHEILRFT